MQDVNFKSLSYIIQQLQSAVNNLQVFITRTAKIKT